METSTHGENLQQTALKYHSQGYAPIPVNKEKKPLIKWKEFQEKQPTKEQVEEWFNNPQCTGIALITGKIYGFFVLDVEKEGLDNIKGYSIPQTVIAISGGGGKHFYFSYPDNTKIGNYSGIITKCDIRGDGGYIIVDPSLHESGNHYKFETPLDRALLKPSPSWLLDLLNKNKKIPFNMNREVPEGKRNSTAAQASGTFLKKHNKEKAWDKLKKWNERNCTLPLSEEELEKVFNSINKSYTEQQKEALPISLGSESSPTAKKSKASRLVDLIMFEYKDGLFVDQFKNPYLIMKVDDHHEVIACKGSAFEEFVAELFWDEEENTLSGDDIKKMVRIISAKAKKNIKNLYNRVAVINDTIYYDLANKGWDIVKIKKEAWQIIRLKTPLFKRFPHQNDQKKPLKDKGDIKRFLKYINLKKDYQKLLLLVFLVTAFVPDIPHVIAVIYGSQGSAKTTLSKLLKETIDPSILGTLAFPHDSKELVQQASHHLFLPYDNISSLYDWATDALCRCVTGTGMSKRILYSDDDDMLYSFKRIISLNGINLASTKPDLLDRSILFELDRISEEQRKTEKQLMKDFYNDLPYILGGIFNTLSKAMSFYPTVSLKSKPRMADWAEWGVAIARALGYSQQEFEDAYKLNGKEQNECILSDNSVASSILEFMENQSRWEGSPTELYNEICFKGGKNIRTMPKSSNALTRKINIVKTNLLNAGIVIENHKDTKKKRGRFIEIINENYKSSSLSSESTDYINNDDRDDRDDNNLNLLANSDI